MAVVCVVTLNQFEATDAFSNRLLRVVGPLTASIVVYLALARLLGMNELWLMFKRGRPDADRS